MEFCNSKKKLEEKDLLKDNMISKLQKLEKLINSELSSKIHNSSINNNELLIVVGENDIIDVVQFLSLNNFIFVMSPCF